MTAFISVKGLSKVYPESVTAGEDEIRRLLAMDPAALAATGSSFALRDVSFDIKDGERVGIIGANGAGKTTLMRIMTGLTQPSLGSVECVGSLQAILTIGTGLREDLTGRENLLMSARLAGHAESELAALTERMVDFAELAHFIDWPVRTYSSGMKARLSFAGVIFVKPEILLIDEALSVGDRHFSVKANEEVRKLCEAGRIVVIVSHSTDAIIAMCDRCIWIDHGRLVKDGPSREVAAEYEEHARMRFERAMLSASKRRKVTLDRRVTSTSDLELSLGEVPASGSIALPRPVLSMAFDLTLTEALPSLAAKITVERLDGLIVATKTVALEGGVATGTSGFEIEIPDFFLMSGFFVISVALLSGLAEIARLFGQIQIDAKTVYSNGHPTLHWPISAEAHAVAASATNSQP